jgi:hypothetical protein
MFQVVRFLSAEWLMMGNSTIAPEEIRQNYDQQNPSLFSCCVVV